MRGLWILPSLIFPLVTGSDNARVTAANYEGLKSRKNITKREVECREGLHHTSQNHESHLCCHLCPAGTRKTADCTVNEGQPTCTHCIDGKEYTEKNNYLDNCRRCDSCDKGHGLEVEKNCTQTQNTKCKCKENYFCNSTPCDTCEPCTTCEHGIVEKCTLTSNTKCKEKGSNAVFWWLLCVLLIIIAVGIWGWCKYKKCNRNPSGHSEPTEKESLNDTEVDLSRYIPYIAEIMKLTEVKEFVRKNDVQESKLDEITNNHPQDTAEQKVQLLINWYQNHGKKGAYNTLISSVPKGIAEKIRDQIKKDINNDDKDADFKNENERQSLV